MILGLLTCFVIKHFIFDFLYQPPYQWKNKGNYGHWGGLLHSGQHSLASAAILTFYTFDFVIIGLLCLFEFIVHYHMDYIKMVINKRMGWTATTHNQFWVWMGFDQLIHSLTYLFMTYALILHFA